MTRRSRGPPIGKGRCRHVLSRWKARTLPARHQFRSPGPPGWHRRSDDPLLSARSAAYSVSFTRRAGEDGRARFRPRKRRSELDSTTRPAVRYSSPDCCTGSWRPWSSDALHRRLDGGVARRLPLAPVGSSAAGDRHPPSRRDPVRQSSAHFPAPVPADDVSRRSASSRPGRSGCCTC